jgi:hypothetical protein
MSLRRPPTKIELKADDIEEFDQITRQRQIDSNESGFTPPRNNNGYRTHSKSSPSRRKKKVVDRIGLAK